MKRNQDHRVVAVYQGATLSAYRGNPLIEALPPINSFLDDSSALKGSLGVPQKISIEMVLKERIVSVVLLMIFFNPSVSTYSCTNDCH